MSDTELASFEHLIKTLALFEHLIKTLDTIAEELKSIRRAIDDIANQVAK